MHKKKHKKLIKRSSSTSNIQNLIFLADNPPKQQVDPSPQTPRPSYLKRDGKLSIYLENRKMMVDQIVHEANQSEHSTDSVPETPRPSYLRPRATSQLALCMAKRPLNDEKILGEDNNLEQKASSPESSELSSFSDSSLPSDFSDDPDGLDVIFSPAGSSVSTSSIFKSPVRELKYKNLSDCFSQLKATFQKTDSEEQIKDAIKDIKGHLTIVEKNLTKLSNNKIEPEKMIIAKSRHLLGACLIYSQVCHLDSEKPQLTVIKEGLEYIDQANEYSAEDSRNGKLFNIEKSLDLARQIKSQISLYQTISMKKCTPDFLEPYSNTVMDMASSLLDNALEFNSRLPADKQFHTPR